MLSNRDLLAKTLQAEAGNQGLGGMMAVGSVIMNRVGSGQSLSDIILAPGQFSAWNSVTGYAGGEQGQDMDAIKPSKDAYAAADAILSGNYADITGGATHYYNPDISQPKWGASAGGDWTKIGAHVFGKADAPKRGKPTMDGQQPMPMQAQPTAQQMQQTQRQPRGLMDFLRDPRTRQAFASMDRSGMFRGIAEQAGRDITRQEQQREQQQLQNRTAEYLKSQPGGERYAQAIIAGMPASEVYRQYQNELGGPSVGARKIYGNGTIVQSTNQGQRVFDPTGKLVTGAEAARVIDEANKYEAEQAQRVAGSKKIGTVTADQAVKAFEKAANVTTSIETIDRAVAAIDDGAMSGFVANYLPNITKASAELQSAMNQMGLDVISTVTFGALSESEMRVAMETAVPRNLSGPQLKEWLIEKRAAQVKARQALERAASYLSVPGNTIASWLELKSGQRQETTTNPYMSKSLQELNEIFARRNELTQSQRDDLIEALTAKKGS